MQSNNGFTDKGMEGNASSDPSKSSMRGQAVQIAKIYNRSFKLDENALSSILLEDSIRNKPLVVISIAGDMRKGKSFLLNFFLRYLESDCGSVDDWIGKKKNSELKGFSWKGGSQRLTIGIVMWSHPFIVKKSDGQEVAVLLMDTQGAFDCEDTVKDSAIIFALSLLTSSTFIYNIHHNLQENNLDNLAVFSNYGTLALSSNGNEKPFQKLVFLIRDWSYPFEYPFGKTGGDANINRYLVKQKTQRNRRSRDFIDNSFEDRIGFLMPYPGRDVATNPNFNGNISSIDPQFIKSVEELVPLILSPDNLIVKRISGSEVNGFELFQYFSEYSKRFAGNELPEPKSLLEATAEISNQLAAYKAFKDYKNRMEELCSGPHISDKLFTDTHFRFRDEALNSFDKSPKMGGIEFSDGHRNNLIQQMEIEFKRRFAQNEAKDIFR